MDALDRLDQLAKEADGTPYWYKADEIELDLGPDDAFIAACTPARVRALIEAARALEWIANDSRPLPDDFDPAEWWRHVASNRRERAIAALSALREVATDA